MIHAVKILANKVKKENLKVVCVASSFQARQLIIENELNYSDLDTNPVLDLSIDSADEVDMNLNCIKGGGGCSTQEKIVASQAKKFIVIADYTKKSEHLGEKWKKGVPIEVIPMAYVPVMRKLELIGGKPKLRMAVSKAGPVVTDNGGFLIDVDFGVINDPKSIELLIRNIVGVVENGLFINMISKVYFGNDDGTVSVITKD